MLDIAVGLRLGSVTYGSGIGVGEESVTIRHHVRTLQRRWNQDQHLLRRGREPGCGGVVIQINEFVRGLEVLAFFD